MNAGINKIHINEINIKFRFCNHYFDNLVNIYIYIYIYIYKIIDEKNC